MCSHPVGPRSAFLAIAFAFTLTLLGSVSSHAEDRLHGLPLQLRISEAKRNIVSRNYYKSVIRHHKLGRDRGSSIIRPADSLPKERSPLGSRRPEPKPHVSSRFPKVR